MTEALDFDDELMRARSIQGVGPASLEPLVVKPVGNLGFSPLSSIGPAKPHESPTLTPPRLLAPPQQNIMVRILETHRETERLADVSTRNFEIKSTQARAEIERLDQEKEEAFLKEIEATKGRDTWETFSTVAQYIASVSSVAMAVSIGWGIPAFLLGAAGVVGGTVRLAHDTHLLQPVLEWFTRSRELQKEIRQNIEICAFCLQVGLGVAGGFAAWQAGYMAAMQAASVTDYATKASSMLGTTSTVMKAGGDIGKAYYNKHLFDHMAELKELDCWITVQNQSLTRDVKEIQAVLRSDQFEEEQIKKAIQKQEVHA